MYRSILVPTDGSPLSAHAVDEALSLAASLGARITLLTAIEPFHVIAYVPEQIVETRDEYERSMRREAERHMREGEAKAKARGVACETAIVASGDPHEAIIDAANERGCDLIAMASHGRRGMKALVIGSVTAKVLTHSRIPVLVYRHKDA